PRIIRGDVQVDGLASTQVITLTGAIVGTTKIALTFNGATSTPFTYNGVGVLDQTAFRNAIISLGVPAANFTVTPDGSDTIFTIVFTTLMGPLMPAITSAIGTGNAALTLPNNIRAVILNGGSISGSGAVASIAMASANATGTVDAGANGQTVKTGILE